MTGSLEKTLARYDYAFPERLIAQSPAAPRDRARLLAYERRTGRLSFGRFSDLPRYLPPGAVLVFNQTKVWPARLILKKDTGGKVVVLYVATENNELKVMADRRVATGVRLRLTGRLTFRVSRHDGKYYFLKPSFPASGIGRVLERHGLTPLPPYIKSSPLSEKDRKERYQTVFARRPGSVAAPTASLHFTRRLLRRLRSGGTAVRFVTLHVGLGTFAPLTADALRRGKLHAEKFEIDRRTASFLNAAKRDGRPIIAVGTTVARTLESAAAKNGRLTRLKGDTDIFIREGRRFRFVDGLITNFHVPRSSLMMLVAAFAGRERLLELYRQAVAEDFRLFSFGDGMLIV